MEKWSTHCDDINCDGLKRSIVNKVSLSPGRNIELAPNRVSFLDTPPDTRFFELDLGFMAEQFLIELMGQRWCDGFCVKFVYANLF